MSQVVKQIASAVIAAEMAHKFQLNQTKNLRGPLPEKI